MRIFFLCIMLFILSTCASPMKTLKKGNYERAYKQALVQLKRGKSVKENEKVLSKSLAKIIDQKTKKKNKLIESKETEKRIKALGINEDLQSRIEKTIPYLDHSFDEDYDVLREEEEWLTGEIANALFHFGKEDLEKAILDENKQLARDAYFGFAKAREYGFDGEEIDAFQDESLAYGQLIYTVEAGETFGSSYDWEIDQEFEDIEDYGSTFRKIYYERSRVENVDCHMDISFRSLDINYYEDTDRQSFSRRVQTGTRTVTDADGNVSEVPVYDDVTADVIKRTTTKVAEWEIRVSIQSRSNNCDLRDERFEERMQSVIEEVQFSGDERAIPSSYTRNSNGRLESDDDMADELLERLYREVVREYF